MFRAAWSGRRLAEGLREEAMTTRVTRQLLEAAHHGSSTCGTIESGSHGRADDCIEAAAMRSRASPRWLRRAQGQSPDPGWPTAPPPPRRRPGSLSRGHRAPSRRHWSPAAEAAALDGSCRASSAPGQRASRGCTPFSWPAGLAAQAREWDRRSARQRPRRSRQAEEAEKRGGGSLAGELRWLGIRADLGRQVDYPHARRVAQATPAKT